jgi:hemerythrin superfamily protein
MADALELLAGDHQEVRDLFEEIQRTADPEKRGNLAKEIVTALSQHAAAEEEVFYPQVSERVAEGEGFVTVSLEEHKKAKIQLKKLARMAPDDPLFDPAIGELVKEVKEHIADEEMQLFPRVRAAFSESELVRLGGELEKRKKAAPARPLPKAPSKPPLNVIANQGAAALDRARGDEEGSGEGGKSGDRRGKS